MWGAFNVPQQGFFGAAIDAVESPFLIAMETTEELQ